MSIFSGYFSAEAIVDILARVEGCTADLSGAGFDRIHGTADCWVKDSTLPPVNKHQDAVENTLLGFLQDLQAVPNGKKILHLALDGEGYPIQFTPAFSAALSSADVYLEIAGS